MTKMTTLAAGALTALLLILPGSRAWAASNAVPGTVNYVEGTVLLNGNPVTSKQIGSLNLGPDDVLNTERGKAEVLLTPGVFLRAGENSEIRMVRPELADTRVNLDRGEAMVEVAEIYKENHIDVGVGSATTQLKKTGLYRFDANANTVAVLDGEAEVTTNGGQTEVKKGHDLALTAANLKTEKFNVKDEDELYRWSSLRSQYLADASLQSARTVYVNSDPWFGSGWFWNPAFSSYAWLPGSGYFYSPFGYPFFSPGYVAYAPYVRWPNGRFAGSVGNVRVGSYRGVTSGRAAPAMRMGSGFAAPGGVMTHAGGGVRR